MTDTGFRYPRPNAIQRLIGRLIGAAVIWAIVRHGGYGK